MNTLVVVQVGQSQTAHGGMLYVTTPGDCGPSGFSKSARDKGEYARFDGPTSSGSGAKIIVGFADCFAGSGDSVSEAEAIRKHSVNADVI